MPNAPVSLEGATPRRWRPGMVIGGKFVLTRQLGEGGLATVFEARHVTLGRRVAIKVLNERFASDYEAVVRLQREAVAASSIEHPNIVEIFDIAQDPVDGAFFIVQRLMQGTDLRAYLRERPRPGVIEVLDILLPVMGALGAVHALGIVHRDIKPENVFLARTPVGGIVPTLIDFGIAKLDSPGSTKGLDVSRAGFSLGTPDYMAPEQIRNEKSDARADVWAIGVVLFEMLAGHRPFEGAIAQQVMMRIATEDAPPLDPRLGVPAELSAIVRRALARDRERRFADMAEMIRAVLQVRVDGSDVGAFLGERHRASIGRLLEEPTPASEIELSSTQHPPVAGELGAAGAPGASTTGYQRVALVDEPSVETARAEATLLRSSARAPRGVADVIDAEIASSPARPAVAAAFEALQLNALDDCVARAEHALVAVGNDAALICSLRMLQATASLWLGRWPEAERFAAEAFEFAVVASPAWLAVLGTRISIAGLLGDRERLDELAAALRGARKATSAAAPFVVAAARLSTELLRLGRVADCDRWLELARTKADGADAAESREEMEAWISGVCAERAAYEGNVGEALRAYEASAAAFAEAGDSRQACRQRGNVGNLLLSLGAYREAADVLSATLAATEPMGVYFVTALRANLGLARFRLGDPEAAPTLAQAAEQARAQGDARVEAFTRAYRAQALAASAPAEALAEARAACELGEKAPASRAYALAVLAEQALAAGDAAQAVAHAREAYRLSGELRGAEGADTFVRVTLASALLAHGERIEAGAVAAAARDRLLRSAGRIGDAQLRTSYLGRVPENARLLELVRGLG